MIDAIFTRVGSLAGRGRLDTAGLARNLREDVLLRNSLYLMASTGVMAVFGFAFWLVAARLYTPEAIGLASTLVMVMTMLAIIARLGFNNAFVKFLPHAKEPNDIINTGLLATGGFAALLGVAMLLLLPVVSPPLAALTSRPDVAAVIVAALVMISANTLTDSVFVARQRAGSILGANTALSITKLLFAMLLVSLGALGLLAAFILGVLTAAVVSFVAMRRLFGYRFRFQLSRPFLRESARFTGGSYLVNVIDALPTMVLPVMATTLLGATGAAHYNLAMTFAALLYAVPLATASSLFAETSNSRQVSGAALRRTLKHTGAILLPGVAVILLLGSLLLRVFGENYASGGAVVLQLLALSAIPFALNAIISAVLLSGPGLSRLLWGKLAGNLLLMILAYVLMARFGTFGAGAALLAGETVMAAILSAIAWRLYGRGARS